MAFFQNKKEDPAQETPQADAPQGTSASVPLAMGDDIFQSLGENFFKDAQAPAAPKP